MANKYILLVITLAVLVGCAYADTPAHCLHSQIQGNWTLYLGDLSHSSRPDCTEFDVSKQVRLSLVEPDKLVWMQGMGFWTMIYDEGFEMEFDDLRFFGFSNWTDKGGNITSNCDLTNNGWYYPKKLNPDEAVEKWGCFYAKRDVYGGEEIKNYHRNTANSHVPEDHVWQEDRDFANKINSEQSLWTASSRSHFHGMKMKDILRTSGQPIHHPFPKSQPNKGSLDDLPTNWDWRNASGVDYTIMRDQLSCGSCYCFSVTSMLTERYHIEHGISDFMYSVQDPVSCNPYGQGCNGGMPYLVAKYGYEEGFVLEQCFGYMSGIMKEAPCKWKCDDPSMIHFADDYHYVGDYFGGCSEQAMMEELYKNGPVSVAFEVYPDFEHYTGGIYHHTTAQSEINPTFDAVNHAVLIVGYGVDEHGTKFWKVQNSWGRHFGEDNGFFRILRGVDECGIESMAVGARPVYTGN